MNPMQTDDVEVLIRRNRVLLAQAREECRVSQETRSRAYEIWLLAMEARQRAWQSRERCRLIRSSELLSHAQARG